MDGQDLSPALYALHRFPGIRSDKDFASRASFGRKTLLSKKLKYQATTIVKSLTELPPPLAQLARKQHKLILFFCNKKNPGVKVVHSILKTCKSKPGLVDEVYVQLLKHVTENPNYKSTCKGWMILCLMTNSFAPSEELVPFVYTFLRGTTKEDSLLKVYARYAERRLDGILKVGASNHVPPIEEIEQYLHRPPAVISLELVDGTQLAENLPVNPDMRTVSIVELCLDRLGMDKSWTSSFGVYLRDRSEQQEKEYDLPLAANSYVADVAFDHAGEEVNMGYNAMVFKQRLFLTSFEGPKVAKLHYGAFNRRESKFSAAVRLLRQRTSFVTSSPRLGLPEPEVFESFKSDMNIYNKATNDEVYERLQFIQMLDEITSGHWEILTFDESIEVTALASYIRVLLSLGDPIPVFPMELKNLVAKDKNLCGDIVNECIPPSWKKNYPIDEFERYVYEKSESLPWARDVPSLQQAFVDQLQRHPLFGANLFRVPQFRTKAGYGNQSPLLDQLDEITPPVLLAVRREGVALAHPVTQKILMKVEYKDIYQWQGSTLYFGIVILDPKTQSKDQAVELILSTPHTEHISALLHDYCSLDSKAPAQRSASIVSIGAE